MGDQEKTATAPEGQSEKVSPESTNSEAKKASDTSSSDALAALKKQISTREEENNELRAKLDTIERQQVEKSGDLKKILKLERESNAKLKAEHEALQSKIIETKIKSEIAEKAKDAHSTDALMKLGDISKITVAGGKVYGVDEFVANIRKSNPYSFKVKSVNAGPQLGPTTPKDFGQNSNAEYLKKLDKVRTANELSALRKEYGVESGDRQIMRNGQLQMQ